MNLPGPPSDAPAELFRPMERRSGAAPEPAPPPKRLRRADVSQPGHRMIFLRVLRWLRIGLRYAVATGVDRLRGRASVERRAATLRRVLESAGGTSVKVAKQCAGRLDLLSLEFSVALAAMKDVRPPMEFDVAMERTRAAVGRPLDQVFEVIDPMPIASSTVDCVYQARLRSGEAVAIKVRRTGIREQILADMAALGTLTRFLELLTVVRPGFFDYLRAELTDLAREELDFSRQARAQVIFRKRTRRAGIRWLSAPRVFQSLSDDAVMISELMPGVRLSEVIAATEAGDRRKLMELAKKGVDPHKVARRLLHASWWGLFENLFFLAQPAPENIVIQPGNRLIMLSFEDTSTLTASRKRMFRLAFSRMADEDVSGAANAVTRMVSPLPFIDVYDFTKSIEASLWQELFAYRDDEAEWWERTTIGFWRAVLDATNSYGVSLRQEVLWAMRATSTVDIMAAQLRPDLKLLSEFRRYQRLADRREARKVMRDLDRRDLTDVKAGMIARTARVVEGVTRLGLWIESSVENMPVSNLALSGKAAYMFSELIRFVSTCLGLLVGGSIGWALVTPHPDMQFDIAVLAVLFHPLYGVVVSALAAFTLRRVLFRLDDKGSD